MAPSMCTAFEAMIDKAKNIYGMCIVAFCCNNVLDVEDKEGGLEFKELRMR
jgi:hypothetical protein